MSIESNSEPQVPTPAKVSGQATGSTTRIHRGNQSKAKVKGIKVKKQSEEVQFKPGTFPIPFNLLMEMNPEVFGLFDFQKEAVDFVIDSEVKIVMDEANYIIRNNPTPFLAEESIRAVDYMLIAKRLCKTESPLFASQHGDETNALSSFTSGVNPLTFDLFQQFGSFEYNGVNYHPRDHGLLTNHYLIRSFAHVANVLSSQHEQNPTVLQDAGITYINVANSHDVEQYTSKIRDDIREGLRHLTQTLTYYETPDTRQDAERQLVYRYSEDAIDQFITDNEYPVGLPEDLLDKTRLLQSLSPRAIREQAIGMSNITPIENYRIVKLPKVELISELGKLTSLVQNCYFRLESSLFNIPTTMRSFVTKGNHWQLVSLSGGMLSAPGKLSAESATIGAILARQDARISVPDDAYIAISHPTTGMNNMYDMYRKSVRNIAQK